MILTEEVPLLAAPTHQLYQQNQLQYSDEDQRFFAGKEKENKNKHICKQALNTRGKRKPTLINSAIITVLLIALPMAFREISLDPFSCLKRHNKIKIYFIYYYFSSNG